MPYLTEFIEYTQGTDPTIINIEILTTVFDILVNASGATNSFSDMTIHLLNTSTNATKPLVKVVDCLILVDLLT